MRFYRRSNTRNIIIPIYPAAVFAGDRVGKLGDIKYIYYPAADGTYGQAPGVYAESSGGTITCQPGQSILTITTEYESTYGFSISYNSSASQTIQVVQGRYYFVIPGSTAFVALEDGTIVATLYDSSAGAGIDTVGFIALFKSMYGLNLEIQ